MAKTRSPPRKKTSIDYSVYREEMLDMYNFNRKQGYKHTRTLELVAEKYGTVRSTIQGQIFPEFKIRRNRTQRIKGKAYRKIGIYKEITKLSSDVSYFIRSNFPKVLEAIFTPNEALYLSDISNRIRDYSIREKGYDFVIKDSTILTLNEKHLKAKSKPLIELIKKGNTHDSDLYKLLK